jgi:nucleoid DNA-binding protein
MNKAELISLVAAKADVTKVTASSIIDLSMEAITEALGKGEPVQFVGFGTFSVAERKARIGRNPQTGKEIKIAAKRVVRFKAGGALTEAANKHRKKT